MQHCFFRETFDFFFIHGFINFILFSRVIILFIYSKVKYQNKIYTYLIRKLKKLWKWFWKNDKVLFNFCFSFLLSVADHMFSLQCEWKRKFYLNLNEFCLKKKRFISNYGTMVLFIQLGKCTRVNVLERIAFRNGLWFLYYFNSKLAFSFRFLSVETLFFLETKHRIYRLPKM